MKLRVRGNSIRLRLTRTEVERLAAGDAVEETVELIRPFRYSLEAADTDEIAADFDGERIRVVVPRDRVADWAATKRVGIESVTGGVRLLIEKDFACLSPRGEDESNMFVHPGGTRC